MRILKVLISFCLFVSLNASASMVEIPFWHSLAGEAGVHLSQMVQDFNKGQSEFQVKPIYKGEYLESLTSLASAFRAHQAPAMIQVYEVGSGAMLAPIGIIKPVHELLKEQNTSLTAEHFFPAVKAFYSDESGLMAMPFNISVPVLFYNKAALASIGVDEQNFPKTWQDLERVAKTLIHHGYDCAYTSAYPSWILLESFLSLHGLPMIDVQTNKAQYNNSAVITHFNRLKYWQQNHLFTYGGRDSDATFLFTSGRCPLFSQSSGSYQSLKRSVPFPVGVAPLPIDSHIRSNRFDNVAGGAAIWVIAGQSEKTYQGIARFMAFISSVESQRKWHLATGYLPLGLSGDYQSILTQYDNPLLSLAKHDLHSGLESRYERRFSAQNQIRLINDEMLEAIFADIKNPSTALTEGVRRANHVLKRFEQNTHTRS